MGSGLKIKVYPFKMRFKYKIIVKQEVNNLQPALYHYNIGSICK